MNEIENLDDKILLCIKDKEKTVREIISEIGQCGSEMLVDKRVKMLRKWNLVEFRVVDKGTRGRKPLSYIASDRARKILENKYI